MEEVDSFDQIPCWQDTIVNGITLDSPVPLIFGVLCSNADIYRVNFLNPIDDGLGLSARHKSDRHVVIPGSEPGLVSNASPA